MCVFRVKFEFIIESGSLALGYFEGDLRKEIGKDGKGRKRKKERGGVCVCVCLSRLQLTHEAL